MPKHKVLKSVARSVADMFTSTLNYSEGDYVMTHIIVWARESGNEKLVVDLLSGHVEPDEFMECSIAGSVAATGGGLSGLVESSGSDIAFVRSAQLTLELHAGPTLSHYRCSVQIVDDRGKVYEGTKLDKW